MDDAILMKKLKALEERYKSIDDFGLLKWNGIMSSFTIFYLGFKSGLSSWIKKAIVVDNGSEEERMSDVRAESSIWS